jgi:hypothetical protein
MEQVVLCAAHLCSYVTAAKDPHVPTQMPSAHGSFSPGHIWSALIRFGGTVVAAVKSVSAYSRIGSSSQKHTGQM